MGPVGAQGYTGPAGRAGGAGAMGPQGPPGTGIQGWTGASGSKGGYIILYTQRTLTLSFNEGLAIFWCTPGSESLISNFAN